MRDVGRIGCRTPFCKIRINEGVLGIVDPVAKISVRPSVKITCEKETTRRAAEIGYRNTRWGEFPAAYFVTMLVEIYLAKEDGLITTYLARVDFRRSFHSRDR
jgi:hypothetical protein